MRTVALVSQPGVQIPHQLHRIQVIGFCAPFILEWSRHRPSTCDLSSRPSEMAFPLFVPTE
jgi:hypothetical protein